MAPRPGAFHSEVRTFKRRLIEDHLRLSGGNRAAAARALNLQRTYLHALIRDLGVEPPPNRNLQIRKKAS